MQVDWVASCLQDASNLYERLFPVQSSEGDGSKWQVESRRHWNTVVLETANAMVTKDSRLGSHPIAGWAQRLDGAGSDCFLLGDFFSIAIGLCQLERRRQCERAGLSP